ncbi:hypothetical protein ACRAWF_41710 [Streptomyces sp. L7]
MLEATPLIAPTSVPPAPLLPGVPSPAGRPGRRRWSCATPTAPVVAGAAVMSPLIRPLNTNPPVVPSPRGPRPPMPWPKPWPAHDRRPPSSPTPAPSAFLPVPPRTGFPGTAPRRPG